MDLPDALFAGEINENAVHDAVVAYLANQRQGDASTKERSDVKGGGAKPYRQKGTGRARAGTIRSPIFRGGGVVFGPHPRSYRKKLSKKVRRLALCSSLTARAGEGVVAVVKDLDFPEPKTREFVALLTSMQGEGRKTLVVVETPNENTIKSMRNIPRVRITLASNVSTYDVVWAERLLVTEGALRKMEEVFA